MPGGIRYYAESVLRSEIFQLKRRDDPDRYLHVIAFIAHQFYRLQDNLVDVLLTSLRSFQNGAIREPKEQCYAKWTFWMQTGTSYSAPPLTSC